MCCSVFSILNVPCLQTSGQTRDGPDITETFSPTQTNGTSRSCSCPTVTPATTAGPASNSSSPASALGLLTITWMRKCEGDVSLIFFHASNSTSAVCHDNATNTQSLLRNVCENRKGCKDAPQWHRGRGTPDAFVVTESGAEKRARFETLRVQSTGWSTACVLVLVFGCVCVSEPIRCSLQEADTTGQDGRR